MKKIIRVFFIMIITVMLSYGVLPRQTRALDFNQNREPMLDSIAYVNDEINTKSIKTSKNDINPPTINTSVYTFEIGKDIPGNIDVDVSDNVDNQADLSIYIDDSEVNYNSVGEYPVTLTVTDTSGNTTTGIIIVCAVDEMPPTVNTLFYTFEIGKDIPGTIEYDVSDNFDTKDAIVVEVDDSAVNYNEIGEYPVKLTVSDTSGNTTVETVVIFVVDKTPPIVNTLNYIFEIGKDTPGNVQFDISDNYDNFTALQIEVDDSAVDYNVLGDYPVLLVATDSNGNTSTTTIIMSVIDSAPPIINRLEYNHRLGIDTPGNIEYEVADNFDVPSSLIINANDTGVNYNAVGSYSIELSVSDTSGNMTTETVIINVIDVTPPVLQTTVVQTMGTPINNSMFTAVDNYSTVFTYTIDDSAVDYSKSGSYISTVTVADEFGNSNTYSVTVNVTRFTLPKTGFDSSVFSLLAIACILQTVRRILIK